MKPKKLENIETPRKRKRIVPTRPAGTPAFENPADELFATAFATIHPPESQVKNVEDNIATTEVNSGYLANQNTDDQLASESNQIAGELANQSASSPVDQKAAYDKYPSRRLRKQKGLRLPAHKLEKWELWCFMNKVDFQDAVEIGLDWLTSQPASHVLNDDIDEEKETDEVIFFYQKWTGNKIRPKDREARKTVDKFSVEICQIGIIRAIVKAPSRINSFSYCVPVIEQAFEETQAGGVTDLKGYLKYLIDAMVKSKTK